MQETHDTVLCSDVIPDFRKLDKIRGTQLADNPPRTHVLRLPVFWRWFFRMFPDRARLLRESLIMREFLRVERRYQPSLWAATLWEAMLPQPGLQYVHYPNRIRLLEDSPADWGKVRSWVWKSIRSMSGRLGSDRAVPASYHHLVANSKWTIAALDESRELNATLVYPPVAPFESGLPWAERANRVVCLGRWVPSKRLEILIEIVSLARRAGASDLTLALAGHGPPEEKAYHEAMRSRYGNVDWVEWHDSPGREELMKLAGSSRYGLHAMIDEHFGIAIAELMTAGCVVFSHNSGGPPEILGDERQLYDTVDEAASRLAEVYASEDLQRELHEVARPRGLRFTPEKFCAAIREEIKTTVAKGLG